MQTTRYNIPQKILAEILGCSLHNAKRVMSSDYKKQHKQQHVAYKVAKEYEKRMEELVEELRQKYAS